MAENRRQFLKYIGGVTAGAAIVPLFTPLCADKVKAASLSIEHLSPDQAAMDEDFWFEVQQAYTSSPGVINLNNGGVSPQPVVVQDAIDRYTRISNEGPAYYMWHVLGKGRENVRNRLGDLAGCSPDELAICRNATEALETVIYGLDLKKGDEVLTTNQDYPNMLNALRQRERRDGIKINYISLPVPTDNPDDIAPLFEKAITPKTKVILMCHIINLTGQILPVKKVSEIAHAKGIEVIADGAHSFAHLNFSIPDLGCDYFGTSLHKWLSAPFGSGMLYVKKEKIEKLWPLFGPPEDFDMTDIRKFEHLGTRSFPTELAIGHAINFHNGVGSDRKEARLRYLKNYWAERVLEMPGVKLNTSLEAVASCAIGNMTVEGKDSADLQRSLMNDHKI
ncbi:MAG: aminotransferase class V-fold PLP-dependent enzyme, partial [Bacteroidetes bacterium]|nr:aminotransferase class V-fold PLP-dependent enzyme [Bacteroidota bacterium]